MTDAGKIYILRACARAGSDIWSFNPGDTTAVRVQDVYVRAKTLVVQEEAVYVLDQTGQVHEFDLLAPIEL